MEKRIGAGTSAGKKLNPDRHFRTNGILMLHLLPPGLHQTGVPRNLVELSSRPMSPDDFFAQLGLH
jgi:hypothetical protein